MAASCAAKTSLIHQGVHEVPLRVVCDVWHQEVDVGFGSCGGASLTEVVLACPDAQQDSRVVGLKSGSAPWAIC